ncbi:hypothetical protein ANME2D_02363 [Candidatus Methanoperedens nitroreducens]|uniref:Uncharacterized protein n=1 Tax=Candidatus Methanoperedens nitratireducens TaxID=1392998 RepID=A0A062V4U2_9EURY|nr:hypothetical protein [Candidatus Methanoperedens nitroreducens]KCZ71628.1 hypothetical protein ANME2D_02363 [Candidatus Methanoperedens nitroreducens]MDJ1421257.1 hypothetical protein [Candidatus Methanoperedens sp.]
MSFGRSTQGRRDGTNQQDRREIRENRRYARTVAHMNDGSTVEIRDLAHQVKLAMSGNVRIFERLK